MAAWPRLRFSFSSLPTTTSPSSSPSSSSASLCPPSLLDLADDLWFHKSVLPLPSFSLPCLPALFFSSSSPDPSTLIAQCMITHLSPSPRVLDLRLSLSYSSSLPAPAPDSDSRSQGHLPPWVLSSVYPTPREDSADAYNEDNYHGYAYGGYSSLSDSDEEEGKGSYRGYTVEDEEVFHYYTAPSEPSDWDDAPSDCEGEDEDEVHVMKEEMLHAPLDPGDALKLDNALSGIYDADLLLKDQHQKKTHLQKDAALLEQREMKENLKQWAHAVASTLPWKAAAKARPLL